MDMSERVEILTQFFDCQPQAANRLNDKMALKEFRHKEILTHQGDNSAHVWLIVAGNAQLQIIDLDGQIKLLNAHGPGEIFGAFPEEGSALADVIAQNKLVALQISVNELQKLLRDEATLGAGLSRILGEQFNMIMDRMAARITLTAVGRVYDELLRQSGECNIISPPPVIAALAMNAQTTRETGSRAINALERRGIISRDEDGLTINSRAMLEELIV